MAKPISFGFGKPKGSSNSALTASKISISPASKRERNDTSSTALKNKASILRSGAALQDEDDEDHDDEPPKHEELTGFSTDGAILSKPIAGKPALVIENAGNADWRKRARRKNLLPTEVQAAQNGGNVVMVEKDIVSTASGLQLADPATVSVSVPDLATREPVAAPTKSADEEALQALLTDDPDKPRGTAIIEARQDIQFGSTPAEDSIEHYPESSTLEEYAAMPVEEFGLAMLRGMGKKRRAMGEVIQLETDKPKESKKRKQEGFLGIGAKPAPGMEGVEIGAWGKADMRKNNRGTGFFTPVMVRDAKTGETITEEELESRIKQKSDSQAQSLSSKSEGRRSERRYDSDHRNSSRERQRRPRYRDENGDDARDGRDKYTKSPKRSSGGERDRHRDRERHGDRIRERSRDRYRSPDRDRNRHSKHHRDRDDRGDTRRRDFR